MSTETTPSPPPLAAASGTSGDALRTVGADMATLAAMARIAREAATLMPPNIAPGQFNTWATFRAAFDAVDAPMSAFVREQLAAVRPGVAWAQEIDTETPDGEVWVV